MSITSIHADALSEDEYGVYYKAYIEKAPIGNLQQSLLIGKQQMLELFASISEDKHHYRYAPDKWSVQDIIQHIIDAERVFAYRALRFARQDKTGLPGFDQDYYALMTDADQRDFQDLVAEYQEVRQASVRFFQSLSDSALAYIGTASSAPMSARAIGFIIAGHEQHHAQVLRERYL